MESLPPVVILSEAKNLRTDSPAKGVAFAKILRCAQDDTFFGFCGWNAEKSGTPNAAFPTAHHLKSVSLRASERFHRRGNPFPPREARRRDVGIAPYNAFSVLRVVSSMIFCRERPPRRSAAPKGAGSTLIRRCAPPSPRGRLFGMPKRMQTKKPGFFAEARNFYADLIS